jgi:hypothetical protein
VEYGQKAQTRRRNDIKIYPKIMRALIIATWLIVFARIFLLKKLEVDG